MTNSLSNKEVIDSLEKFFLQSDPKVVARSLAGMFIDMNRIANVNDLEDKEFTCLKLRIKLNSKLVQLFASGKNDEILKYLSINSDEIRDNDEIFN